MKGERRIGRGEDKTRMVEWFDDSNSSMIPDISICIGTVYWVVRVRVVFIGLQVCFGHTFTKIIEINISCF